MPFSHLFENESVQIEGTGPFKCIPNLDVFRSLGATLSKIAYDPFLLTQKKSKCLSICCHCHLGHLFFGCHSGKNIWIRFSIWFIEPRLLGVHKSMHSVSYLFYIFGLFIILLLGLMIVRHNTSRTQLDKSSLCSRSFYAFLISAKIKYAFIDLPVHNYSKFSGWYNFSMFFK